MKKDISLPFDGRVAEQLAEEFGTPLYVYDEQGIRAQARKLRKAFIWANAYKNFFAVKATPTPGILKILHEEGMGFDCSSRTELLMMQKMGVHGTDIFYTSNNTPREDFELAIKLGATVNIDDFSQVPVFLEALGTQPLERVAARYNPGDRKAGNAIIGDPKEAKFGMSLEALVGTFNALKESNISRFGLHTMVASNELDPRYFEDTARLLLEAVAEIEKRTGIRFEFVNLGGGFGVNYQLEQGPFDLDAASELIRLEFERVGRKDLQVFTENGRYVTGPYGYLITRVRYLMRKNKPFAGVDASMQNLMRPGMYGAYHHISVLGKTQQTALQEYDVVGSLCENNDKFAINRQLPLLGQGDLLVIHDAGAHAHAMGFNYNGLLRSAEVLLNNGGGTLIRRAETPEDYFKNMVWS